MSLDLAAKKLFSYSPMTGAIDSAVPCAMILSMMDNLNKLLMKKQLKVRLNDRII